MIDAANEVMSYTGFKARIELHPQMPTSPRNRVADNSLTKKPLGWKPKVKLMDGLHRTIDRTSKRRSTTKAQRLSTGC